MSQALADLPDGFELDHLALALEYVQQFRTAVDGGAHRGIWTREIARRFRKVWAFEPVAENRSRIPRFDNVCVLPRVLGAEPQLCEMAAGEENSGEWHVTDARPFLKGEAGLWVYPLDHLSLSDLDFLKLDVEGYELFALQGARETILRCKPVICVESKWHCTRYGIPEGEEVRYLESLGMHVASKIGRDVICVW